MEETSWKSYEDVARFLLDEMAAKFGLDRVEGKQAVDGRRSGTRYVIDAKGIADQDELFVIVECRRFTTSRQKQEHLAGLAYRIHDTGAAGGIIVTPLRLQKGAEMIARAENIHSVQLDENSTTENYILKFLNDVRVGRTDKVGVEDIVVPELRDEP